MPVDYNFFKGSLNPINIFRTIAFNMEFDKQHPDYFYPEGITIFTGAQRTTEKLYPQFK